MGEGRRKTSRENIDQAPIGLGYRVDKQIDVGDICAAAQVSQRTLEYAFIERFGVIPKAYLKIYRLNSVRRQLRLGTPQTDKVSDIANEWGFWHLGQFAADYRAQFDELPSQTLQRLEETSIELPVQSFSPSISSDRSLIQS